MYQQLGSKSNGGSPSIEFFHALGEILLVRLTTYFGQKWLTQKTPRFYLRTQQATECVVKIDKMGVSHISNFVKAKGVVKAWPCRVSIFLPDLGFID